MSLAHELKERDPNCNLVYIGHKGDNFDNLQEGFHDFDFIGFLNAGKFRRYHGESFLSHLLDFKTIALNVRDLFRVAGSVFKAWHILAKVKPSVIFAKGGFVAVPVGIAAKMRGIPIITHDSDVLPGLANRIVGRWAVVHATGMPVEFYNYPEESTVYVGIPMDERIKLVDKAAQLQLKKKIGVAEDSFVILVTGGSLGAQSINQKFLEIAPEILALNTKIHIIHIVGQKNHVEMVNKYTARLDPGIAERLEVIDFSGEIYKYSGAADLIISRAGATMLAEFAVQAKACILIPNPVLTGGHQLKNAEELKKIGAVEVVSEEASPEKLLGVIVKLVNGDKKRKILANRLGATAKSGAAADLAEIILKIANNNSEK